jgi:hypothetical protein
MQRDMEGISATSSKRSKTFEIKGGIKDEFHF